MSLESNTLDLATVAQSLDGDYTVVHPVTGAPTAARLKLAGPEHEVRKAAFNARQRVIRAEMVSTGKYKAPDPIDTEADDTAFSAVSTLGWSGLSKDGAPLTFEIGAAHKLYSDPQFRWLRDQVLEAMAHRELFFKASAIT
jgi:hypothetical protein